MNQRSSYPLKKLGEITIIGRGSSPRPIRDKKYFDGGKIPWIKIADATSSGKYLYKTKQYVNEYGASFSRRLKAGNVIIAASGTLGYTQILGVEGCVHDGWLYFSDIGELDRDYLYYTLQWLNRHFYNQASGAAIQNINTDILRNTEIPYPSVNIQKQVGEILSTYDNLIENNNRRIAILEDIAQSLHQEWFVKFCFPGYQNTKLKESSLGLIPEGWEVKNFTEIADVLGGGTPKTKEPTYWDGDIPFFAPKDAPDSFYATTTEKHVTELGIKKSSTKLYPKDTVFITARGTVGKVVLPSKDMTMNQSCYALKAKNDISQKFLFLMIKTQVAYLKKNTGGATFDTIVTDTFKTMKVILPHVDVIQEFDRIIAPKFDQILNLTNKNLNLKFQRDLLLPKLISGIIKIN